ncbi:exodeoxyribonuclease III [Pseudactinotalea terrae]|uniref:exodeoxyribonuclease III n=1 Tax=Pseudactinotalea terrae TaxID=1743262 RepID=UPI0012E293CF|nr:exodeoxyribonuclease III [Pseudactinotalea terrae]
MGSEPLTVATVNVNGIRAAFRRGMPAWLTASQPDVLLLQEVRAPSSILTEHLGPDWHLVHHEAPTAGRAGVAIASRLAFQAVRLGLPGEPTESVGRWVESDLLMPDGETLTVISTYVHTATARTPSMAVKLAFLERATARLAELAEGRAVLGGDLNVAHDERDIKNWKGNRGKSGFLPQEQAYLTRWRELGWVDAARTYAGDVEGPYTWWSWRGRAYDNDAGWRIDYLWCSAALAPSVREVTVDRAPGYEGRWSDHAPVRAVLSQRDPLGRRASR